ncbi:hypothetical protein KI387_012319, partial [Taxus chinensis]
MRDSTPLIEDWEVKDGFTEGEDGDRASTGIPSEDHSGMGEEIEKTLETSKTTLSSTSCKESNPTKDLVDGEIVKIGENFQTTTISVKNRSHLSKVTSIVYDDRGMKLLANVVAYEPSNDEQVSFGNSGRRLFVTADDSLDKSA